MKQGFSLIELIVSVSIMILIVGGVVTSYNSYNDQQKIRQVALTLKSDLRLAQSSATGSKVPTSQPCTDFAGFVVSAGEQSYTIGPTCSEGTTYDEAVTTMLPPGVQLSMNPSSFTFFPIGRGVSADVQITIASEQTAFRCIVSITRIGLVNDSCQ